MRSCTALIAVSSLSRSCLLRLAHRSEVDGVFEKNADEGERRGDQSADKPKNCSVDLRVGGSRIKIE